MGFTRAEVEPEDPRLHRFLGGSARASPTPARGRDGRAGYQAVARQASSWRRLLRKLSSRKA